MNASMSQLMCCDHEYDVCKTFSGIIMLYHAINTKTGSEESVAQVRH